MPRKSGQGTGSGRPAKSEGGGLCVKLAEDFRVEIESSLRDFMRSDSENEKPFPKTLTNVERAFIHEKCIEFGLKSKSQGKGSDRFLVVYKTLATNADDHFEDCPPLKLTKKSKSQLFEYLNRCPLSKDETKILDEFSTSDNAGREKSTSNFGFGRLAKGRPKIPKLAAPKESSFIQRHKANLPITKYKDDIIEAIKSNQVTMIVGETGSGKTTQVPQYLLENGSTSGVPVRIICTEPRRIAAISVSERVADETMTKIGGLVGYQIRLESKSSPETLLTFCTNGVLLRTLMSGRQVLKTITHILVDEIHERDKFSDFLLTVLREALKEHPHLKLVLMSATMDVDSFLNYFDKPKYLRVPGKLFPVKEFYLEDILTVFENPDHQGAEANNLEALEEQYDLEEYEESEDTSSKLQDALGFNDENSDGQDESFDVVVEPKTELDTETKDSAVSKAFTGDFQALSQLLEESPDEIINHKHSETGVTPAMAAACHGNIDVLEEILLTGLSDLSLTANNGWSVTDFAMNTNHPEITEYIRNLEESAGDATTETETDQDQHEEDEEEEEIVIAEDQKRILERYLKTFNDDLVDYSLICRVIDYIANVVQAPGAILVFLPGYEDIISVKSRIRNPEDYEICMLHSQMPSQEQRRVFRNYQKRKVILATNIAETSITIDDVVFVIDCGKVKELCYDSLGSISSLKTTWISRNSATQRKGRAGRTDHGYCFRMFSRFRFQNMADHNTPEILKTPLMELCLQTKLLAPSDMKIEEFLALTPDPPSRMASKSAIKNLIGMEALDKSENVTILGKHLLELPVEPHLGKMILYALALKCLDPVLTIVCCLGYRDPFLLSTNPALKSEAKASKQRLASDSMSDHMVLVRAFKGWQNARRNRGERHFCNRNQVSPVILEIVDGMRNQILGQLKNSGFMNSDVNSNSREWSIVKAALTAGSYPNLARFDWSASQLRTMQESKVRLHPSSVVLGAGASSRNKVSAAANSSAMKKQGTEWFLYNEMTRPGRIPLIKGVTAVGPLTVLLFAGSMSHGKSTLTPLDDDFANLKLDEWLDFYGHHKLLTALLELRQKWFAHFLDSMESNNQEQDRNDFLGTLTKILVQEDNSMGFQTTIDSQQDRQLDSKHRGQNPNPGRTFRNSVQSFAGRDQNWRGQTQFHSNAQQPWQRFKGPRFHQGGYQQQYNPRFGFAHPGSNQPPRHFAQANPGFFPNQQFYGYQDTYRQPQWNQGYQPHPGQGMPMTEPPNPKPKKNKPRHRRRGNQNQGQN